jgi:pyruvate/2-oxoglutarate dehydrogenase complex dihydrolipoamide acyltransferase (E2) component
MMCWRLWKVESKGDGPSDHNHRPSSTVHGRVNRGDQLIKHTVIRKQIAEHMVMSKHTSPHVLTVMEADMSRGQTSRREQGDLRARWGQSHVHGLFHDGDRRGVESLSQRQLFMDG